MPISVEVFVANLRADLVDGAAVTWTDADLLEDTNEAIRATCALRPDAYPVQQALTLVPGTLQNLPPEAIVLFDVSENVSAPNKTITQVDKSLLDEAYRFWPGNLPQAEVDHYTFDPREKTRFGVYPPNNGSGVVTVSFGATPDPVTLSDLLPLADHFEPALRVRALAAAYRRNTQRQDLGKVTGYLGQWSAAIGVGGQAERAMSPKVATSEGVA
jgi:hypothetical protein